MNNKKGFTLVELLAVIAILALLVIIALPNVMSMFNKAKKSSFETEVTEIFKGSLSQWMNDSLSVAKSKIYGKCNNASCGTELDNMNIRSNLEYMVKLDGTGKVTKLFVTDGTYQYEYNGPELKQDDIKEATTIAELEYEDDVLVVEKEYTDETAIELNVCYYGNYYTYYTRKCKSNQTVSSCFNSNNIYHYTREFEKCLGNTYSRSYTSSYINIANNCYYSKANRVKLDNSTLVQDYNNGCYSITPYSTFVYNTGSGSHRPCLSGDCEIIVYDKKKKKKLKKKLRDITYDDLVLAWDFDKGEYVFVKALWIQKLMLSDEYYLLEFSDGTKLKVIGDHRIYNDDAKMFTSVKNEKETPIGMNTINSNGKIIQLISRKLISENIDYCNIITNKHINIYANGILTSHGINNLYKINDMKFVKENRETFNRNDFEKLSDELYEGLRLGEVDTKYLENKINTKNSLIEYINLLIKNKKDN